MSREKKIAILQIVIAAVLLSTGGIILKFIDMPSMPIAGSRAIFSAAVVWMYVRKPRFTLSKLRGTLQIWREDQPETKKELGLRKLKRESIILSFDKSSKAQEYLESDRFKYDIVIKRKMLIEGRKFLLGWKRLFSKKAIAYTVVTTTMPGIIEYKGGISTEIKLYDGDEFSSGGYRFLYSADKKGKRKEDEAGRDILEGRTNGI